MIWMFDKYRLDTDNAVLWCGDEQVDLRPKTFDVLRYLVEHAGDLVRKETLLEAVWQNSYVVEGVLTTSMSELRKVFGDTAKNQNFIATVYRRGYRFIAPVSGADGIPTAAIAKSTQAAASAPGLSSVPRLPGFVGREVECQRLLRQLGEDDECRILTLVGPGGIGKTRLAITVTRRLIELAPQPFADGYYYVPLQSVNQRDEVFSAIADVLELRFSGGESLEAHIHDYLSGKQALLVLDNFEQLISHQELLAELIAAAPRLKLLLTSREALALPEAWFHPVSGLDYEDSPDSDAVRLFARCAARNQPEFDLEEKRATVLRICRLVEGMPLALELAAGWLKMLSMEEVADEIEKGLDILADQHGNEGARHSSVRAVLNETWQRLTEAERTLLKQFSLFQGGASREAISEIIGAGLPILARLVNKALLRTNRKLRYRMHELVRQFAEAELCTDREAEIAARDRHAECYLGWVGEHIHRLRSDEQAEVCREMQDNFDNTRSAWRWAVERERFDWLRQALRSVSLYCDLRGQVPDGLTMFEAARRRLEQSDQADRDELGLQLKLRSAILHFRLSRYDTSIALLREILQAEVGDYERALALRYLGDYQYSHAGHISADEARKHLDTCIKLCHRIGDPQLETECLIELSVLYTNLTLEFDAGRDAAARAVVLARASGRPDLLGNALDVLAWTANHAGDYAVAENIWHEVRQIAIDSGNRSIEALATNWLGWSAWCVGGERLAEAGELFIDARNRYEELGERASVSMSCADLATVLYESGKLQAAREQCRRGLELAEQIGRDDHYVYNLYVLGAIETAAGNFALARDHLRRARVMAWEQEEQTNKPVVVYYQVRLRYAECQSTGDSGAEEVPLELATVLHFLLQYPPTWQAIRDRVQGLLDEMNSTWPSANFEALAARPYDEIRQEALEIVPRLLD